MLNVLVRLDKGNPWLHMALEHWSHTAFTQIFPILTHSPGTIPEAHKQLQSKWLVHANKYSIYKYLHNIQTHKSLGDLIFSFVFLQNFKEYLFLNVIAIHMANGVLTKELKKIHCKLNTWTYTKISTLLYKYHFS